MKKIFLITSAFICINVLGQTAQKIAKSATDFIPAGYVVSETIRGDLNKDNQIDYVFIIKGTDKHKFVKDKYRGTLDRNRRGIIVVFKDNDHYELALENRDCFSSENEEGGNYFPPELAVSISKGNLLLHYAAGRYGYWTYNFRFQNSNFELIGYDKSEDQGPVVERFTSINFATKKMLVKENINQNAEGGDEKFRETWKKFALTKSIKLSEISDFDNFDVESLLGP